MNIIAYAELYDITENEFLIIYITLESSSNRSNPPNYYVQYDRDNPKNITLSNYIISSIINGKTGFCFNENEYKLINYQVYDNSIFPPEKIEYVLNPNTKPIWVYKKLSNLRCNRYKHKIIPKIAIVKRLLDELKVELPINYCKDCDEYFVDKYSLDQVQMKYGALLAKICKCTIKQCADIEFSNFNIESELHSYGYDVSVNGLSLLERKKLFTYLLENKIMDKFSIRRDIGTSLDLFSHRDNYKNACERWRSDLNFVNNYGKESAMSEGYLKSKCNKR